MLGEVAEDVQVAYGSALPRWVGPLRGQDKDTHMAYYKRRHTNNV